jgi:hypothetical protein
MGSARIYREWGRAYTGPRDAPPMSTTRTDQEIAMRTAARPAGLPVKTQLKAGLSGTNHNETIVVARPTGLAIRTQLKAGLSGTNHNEILVAAVAVG